MLLEHVIKTDSADLWKPVGLGRAGLFVLRSAAFILSLIFTAGAFISFEQGAWILLLIGAAMIGVLMRLSLSKSTRPSIAYIANRTCDSMVSAVALALVFAAIGLGFNAKEDHAAKVAADKEAIYNAEPTKLIESLLGSSDAHPTFSKEEDQIKVSYDLDPWSLTPSSATSAFNLHVAKLIPALFVRYGDARTIEVVGRAEFNDKRGNSTRGDAIRITFSRKNSTATNWASVHFGDIPDIADSYWVHPSANR